MDAVKRAAGAVMNSPLFRKKFCSEPRVNEKERGALASREPEIDPKQDLTPFVQGIYHSASFLGTLVFVLPSQCVCTCICSSVGACVRMLCLCVLSFIYATNIRQIMEI